MRVALFGQYPGSSPKSPARELVIDAPSSGVVRPFCAAPRQLRFTEKTYASVGSRADDVTDSPHKKQRKLRLDYDSRWCHARDLMLKQYQRMNDGLPLTLTLLVRDDSPEFSLHPIRGEDSSRRATTSPLSEPDDADDLWEPPVSPYEIPGELVLARERRSSTQYWPAKLMRYIPPRARGQKARYEVLFFDGTVKKLLDDSDMFFNEVHPNFKSCLVRGMHCIRTW